MYYRRKLLLALLQQAPQHTVSKIAMHKLLFLVCQQISELQQILPYDFIPFKYGCYSLSAAKDLDTLNQHYHLITSNEKSYSLNSTARYFEQLTDQDRQVVLDIMGKKLQSDNALIDYVYAQSPYHTINSERTLTPTQQKQQEQQRRTIAKHNRRGLFTLGYEGMSIDTYLNTLIQRNIKLLCDVRKNPVSMKYGFSKKTLQTHCQNLDIVYVHIPQLGIESHLRTDIATAQKRQALFRRYRAELKNKQEWLQQINTLLQTHKRIALTCFEKSPHDCHRLQIANCLRVTNTIHL